MLGHKTKVLKVHRAIGLDDLVPPDTFYRELEVKRMRSEGIWEWS